MGDGALTTYTELLKVIDDLPVILRHVRRTRGLSMRAAAIEAGVSYSTMSRLDRGLVDGNGATFRAIFRWLATLEESES